MEADEEKKNPHGWPGENGEGWEAGTDESEMKKKLSEDESWTRRLFLKNSFCGFVELAVCNEPNFILTLSDIIVSLLRYL